MRLSARIALGLLLVAVPARAAAEDASAAPKVAVVVQGDPDAALVAEAAQAHAALLASDSLLLPSDPALVAALSGGAAPETDDGLGELRAHRRRLGASQSGDREALLKLGRVAGAVAVIVVMRAPTMQLAVFDVGRGAYFADRLPLPASEDATRAFVARRARAAARHLDARAQAAPARPVAAARATERATSAAATAATTEAAPEAPRERRLRPAVRRGLALGAAGALLAGALTFVLVTQLRDDPAPVIHIRPGGQ